MFREIHTTFCESHIDIVNLLASIRGRYLVWSSRIQQESNEYLKNWNKYLLNFHSTFGLQFYVLTVEEELEKIVFVWNYGCVCQISQFVFHFRPKENELKLFLGICFYRSQVFFGKFSS